MCAMVILRQATTTTCIVVLAAQGLHLVCKKRIVAYDKACNRNVWLCKKVILQLCRAWRPQGPSSKGGILVEH